MQTFMEQNIDIMLVGCFFGGVFCLFVLFLEYLFSKGSSVGKDLLLRSQHTDGRALIMVERSSVISLRF